MTSIANGEGGASVRAKLNTVLALNLNQASVHLTAAQIKALNSVPQTLIPAQGAKTVILPIGLALRMNFGTTAFDTQNTFVQWSASPSGQAATVGISQWINETEDAVVATLMTKGGGDVVSLGVQINQPIVLTDDTADATQGDGTIDLTITYSVVTLP